jgi:hypothetical protein
MAIWGGVVSGALLGARLSDWARNGLSFLLAVACGRCAVSARCAVPAALAASCVEQAPSEVEDLAAALNPYTAQVNA